MMIRIVLVILFYLLWQFNTDIAKYYFPYDDSTEETIRATYEYFDPFYYLKDRLHELIMFLGALIPLTKNSRLSTAIMVGVAFSIFCSVVDKFLQNQFSEVLRDWMLVLPASFFLGYLFYKRRWL
ncbi:MAG: hypothetical protein HKN40_12720 [Winogradskyella sp.]|nr:hypothetical protein [Winogradskyella sp.]